MLDIMVLCITYPPKHSLKFLQILASLFTLLPKIAIINVNHDIVVVTIFLWRQKNTLQWHTCILHYYYQGMYC